MRWKRKKRNLQAARDSYSAVHPDVSLADLYEQARPPQHWADIEAGQVDHDLDEVDDEYGVAGYEHQDDEQSARIRSMFQEDTDQRTPGERWRKWRAYGKRHGTEDPEQTADRIERHRVAEVARTARRATETAGRVQTRFDPRTTSNVAQSARQSRALNVRHVEQPPMSARGFDFHGPYRNDQAGQRSHYSDYAWDLRTTGFIHTGF